MCPRFGHFATLRGVLYFRILNDYNIYYYKKVLQRLGEHGGLIEVQK